MDFTLITCSYNTPMITETMLKSWLFKHPVEKTNIILMENSTNNETEQMLIYNNIPFYRRPKTTHSLGVNEALKLCKTKYALLVDTDVIFNKNIFPLLDKFISSGYTLLGERCGNRGQYKLFPRIHPWFCFINIDDLNKHNISFHDQDRIDRTNSNQFYGNVPIAIDNENTKYDVGATMFEDVYRAGLKIGNAKFNDEWFTHYEGLSWYHNVGDPFLTSIRDGRISKYDGLVKSYTGINLRGRFI